MTLYLIGVLISFVLGMFVHYVALREGCIKGLLADVIVTVFVSLMSWMGVLFCGMALHHYFKGE